MERRRLNVANYGSSWLKPPGVPKTLFQMREERREAEEHAEQVRREQQLAAALEAEAGAAGPPGGHHDDDEMLEEEEEEQQDLDDEIPEAEGFGFDGEEDSSEEDEEEEDDNEEEEDGEDEENESVGGSSQDDHALAVMVSPAEQEQVRDMRAAEDRMRELMARGHDNDVSAAAGGDPFLDAEDVAIDNHYASLHQYDNDDDDERAGQMLEEDDLIQHQQQHHRHYHHHDGGANIGDISMGMGMDMDADLDDEIPEADDEDGHGYEHTDSEEDISDDEDGTREISFAGRSSGNARTSAIRRRASRNNMLRQSLQSRTSLAQSDMDISSLLSRDGSSFLGDTPQTRRRGP